MADSGGKGTVAVWWSLIVISVALIAFSPWQYLFPEESKIAEEDSEKMLLVVMEMEGRLLIGTTQTQPGQLEKQLAEMEVWATSDRTVAAVAAVRFFIDPDGNGKQRALALVKARLKNPEMKDSQLLNTVRAAMEHPGQLSKEQQQKVRSTMGWFGKVLLAAGVAEGEPGAEEAAALRMQSMVMMVVTMLMALAVMGIGLLGVALLILGLLKIKSGQLHIMGVPSEIPAQPYLGAFAVYLSLMVIADFLSIAIHPLIAVAGMFTSVGVAFVWPRIHGIGWRDALRGFGWRRGKGILREMGAGVVGYIAMAPVFALGLAATLILILISGWLAKHGAYPSDTRVQPAPIAHPVLLWVANGGWKAKVAVVFLASGLAPLFEETMFRGAFYHYLRSRWNFVVAGLISGLIFASVHPQGLLAIPALTAMGFGFGLIREWRGTLIASMTAHGIHNGVLVGTLIFAMS